METVRGKGGFCERNNQYPPAPHLSPRFKGAIHIELFAELGIGSGDVEECEADGLRAEIWIYYTPESCSFVMFLTCVLARIETI